MIKAVELMPMRIEPKRVGVAGRDRNGDRLRARRTRRRRLAAQAGAVNRGCSDAAPSGACAPCR